MKRWEKIAGTTSFTVIFFVELWWQILMIDGYVILFWVNFILAVFLFICLWRKKESKVYPSFIDAIPSGNIEFPFAFEKTCCRSGVFTDDSGIERMEACFVRHDKMAIRYKDGTFGSVVIDDAKLGRYGSYEMSTGTIVGIRATEGLSNHIARLSDGRLLVFAVHPRGYGELYENFRFLAPNDDGYADYLAEYEQGTDIEI